MPAHAERGGQEQQRGIVTLLLLLILMSVGSYVLLRALNAARGIADQAHTTQRALNTAREALLGYAARYADNADVPLTAGPGRLPCPDTRLDPGDGLGEADSPCASATRTETGRLPWHTLDLPELVDSSGAALWYAVSDAFRAQPFAPINSETAGTLGLGECAGGDDIVALIIAPGEALDGQTRGPANFDVRDYLEGQNQSAGDRCFSAVRDAGHNDQVLAITRRDLMAMVESRVLEEVANALQRYRQAADAYPWLSPFTAPASSPFHGVVGIQRGALPLRQSDPGDEPAEISGNAFAFDAPFMLRWSSPVAGSVVRTGAEPPSEACVRSTTDAACTSGAALASGEVPLSGDVVGSAGSGWQAGACKATAGGRLGCRAVREIDAPPVGLRRTYTVVLTHWPHIIENPGAARRRMQHFSRSDEVLASAPQAETVELELSDTRIEADGSETVLGSARLTLGGGDTVQRFELRDVPFDLEVDDDDVLDPRDPALDPDPDTNPATRRSPGELPQWLTANKWHHLLLVAYAPAHAPGDAGTACATHASGCLTVNWARGGAAAAEVPADALVISAGPGLNEAALAQTRPGGSLADYFEDANALDDLVFDRRDPGALLNDRLRLLDADE